MSVFKAAVVQAAPVGFDVQRTLRKLSDLAGDAARTDAKLAVFPEAFVSAYPKGLDFGARVGSRTPEGREMFRRYFESAIDVPGPATDQIGKIAKATGLYLVVGAVERDGGTLYCTVLFVTPDGALAGKHRKVMPTAMERLIWGTGDGSTLSVIDSPLGRIGAVICWENYMPLLRTAMYAKGVELYCAPTVDCRRTWAPSMRHIAIEGRCFVLSACQFARRSDYPSDYPFDGPTLADAHNDPVLIDGGSIIVNPLGDILAGPDYDGECILTAEIDRGMIAGAKYDLDVVGHYARPDIFQLQVDEREKRAMLRSARE
jgi:nitrilase